MIQNNSSDTNKSRFQFEDLFIILSIPFIIIVFAAFLLVQIGYFQPYLVIIITIISIILMASWFYHQWKIKSIVVKTFSKYDITVIGVVILFAIFNAIYFHDNFFGARDEGCYANSAIYLFNYHNAAYPSVSGFEGRTIAYNGYLAICYTLFRFTGIQLSNVIPIIMGLGSIYFITKRISKPSTGLLAILMFMTTFPMFWFTRRTSNEIFAFGLLWFGMLCFIEGYEQKNNKHIVISILSLGSFALTRTEGFITIGIFTLIIFILFLKKKLAVNWQNMLALILVWGCIIYCFVSMPYYQSALQSAASSSISSISGSISVSSSMDASAFYYNQWRFVWEIFGQYAFLLPVLAIILALILGIRSWNKGKKWKFSLFIIIMLSPYFFYLWHPSIYFDQPWFLRRYIFAILPLGFISLALVLSLLPRKLVILAATMVIVSNMLIASPVIMLREYNGVRASLEPIKEYVTDNDLVFVDRYALEEYGLAAPLYFVYGINTQGVYPGDPFPNIEANYSNYEHVYFLTNNISFSPDAVSWWFSYWPKDLPMVAPQLANVSYSRLELTCQFHRGGNEEKFWTWDYRRILSMSEIPTNVVDNNFTLKLYILK